MRKETESKTLKIYQGVVLVVVAAITDSIFDDLETAHHVIAGCICRDRYHFLLCICGCSIGRRLLFHQKNHRSEKRKGKRGQHAAAAFLIIK